MISIASQVRFLTTVLCPFDALPDFLNNCAHNIIYGYILKFCSPWQVVQRMVTEILTVPGVSRVLYDLTAKPPGTTEWE
jgi:hypothetical protein